jgi:branched-chain amino acid transport system ATP-binding protein
MLKLDNVHTFYGESHILHGVNLEVKENQVVALLGRNGMGKTTTIHSIIGITPPKEGSVSLNSQELTKLAPHKIPQAGVALVPQGRRVFPYLTVKENLTMAERNRGKDNGWTLKKVYDIFPRLEERAHHKGWNLSGGEQQMLCIGRALMTNPDVLLMDEPSEGLAPIVVQELGHTIARLNKENGLSILLVEQDMNMALRVAQYVYILSKGKVVYESTPAELKAKPDVMVEHLAVSGKH